MTLQERINAAKRDNRPLSGRSAKQSAPQATTKAPGKTGGQPGTGQGIGTAGMSLQERINAAKRDSRPFGWQDTDTTEGKLNATPVARPTDPLRSRTTSLVQSLSTPLTEQMRNSGGAKLRQMDELESQLKQTETEKRLLDLETPYGAAKLPKGWSDPGGVNRRGDELTKKQSDLQKELDTLEIERRNRQYEALRTNADFAEKSRYISTRKSEEEIETSRGPLSILVPETRRLDYGDITYDYINRDPQAMADQSLSDVKAGLSSAGLDDSERLEMNRDEIALFNYIYATQSPEAAYRYVKDLTSELNDRQRRTETAQWGKYASERPVQSSAFSVLTSPARGLSYLGQAIDKVADDKIDQNAGYNKFSYIPSAIRGQVSQDVEKYWVERGHEFGGKTASFLYQTGMSMGDFLLNAGITGGNQSLTLAIMGTGAAADATMAAKDRNLTDDQAFTIGTIAGLAEVVTEKVSLEALLKPDWEKGVLNYIIKNAVAEGSEEVASDLINLVADVLVSKEKSEWAQSIRAYMNEGHSEAEATGLAVKDQLLSMGLDFLGGSLSGGIMSGVAGAGHVMTNYQSGKQLNALDLSGEDIQSFVNEGLASDPSTQAYKLATAAQQKLAAGGTLTNYELGNLYQANIRAVAASPESSPVEDVPSTVAPEARAAMPAERRVTLEGRVKDSTIAFGRETVERFTKDLSPALATTLREMYNETQEPAAYLEDMMRAHKAGRDGITDPRVVFGPRMESAHITLFQAQAAMLAGQNAEEDMGYGQVQRTEEAGGHGALASAYGAGRADVPGGESGLQGGGGGLREGVPARGARLAHGGRGGVTTPKAQADYLESQAVAHKSDTIETFRRGTGLEVVVASDEAWEAVFGPGSVKGQSAKALNGKIYLPQDSVNWSKERLHSALTHEGAHAMKQAGYRPYLDLLGDVGSYVDFGSENTGKLMVHLFDHTGVTMEQFLDDPKAQARVYDELCATLSGYDAIGQFDGEFDGKPTKLSDFFRSEGEFNEFLDRLRQVQETFNNQKEVQGHGTEAVHLRNGGQRADGAHPGGQVRELEGGAGQDQGGHLQARPADAGAAALAHGRKVSTASLGIGGGSDSDGIYIVNRGADTPATAAARKLAKENGLRLTLFVGGNLSIKKGGAYASVRGYVSGDRVFIRADHPEYTADQIMRHEAGHNMIAKGEVDLNTVRERIQEKFGAEKADRLAGLYEAAYRGTGLTSGEVWEETICDSLGDMNIFSETVHEGEAREFLEEVKKSASAELETKRNRGPPAETEGHTSIEFDQHNKPYVIIEEDILSGVPKESWIKTVKDNLREKFPDGVTVGRNVISIDKQSRREMTFSKYMQRLMRTDKSLFADKLRATNNADEILQAAQNWVNEALLHPRKDDIIDFSRGDVLLRVGGNDYTAKVIVGSRGEGGLLLYDIINLTPTSIQEGTKKVDAAYTGIAQKERHGRQATPTDTSISETGENVNGKFSMELPTLEDMERRLQDLTQERYKVLLPIQQYKASDDYKGLMDRISTASGEELDTLVSELSKLEKKLDIPKAQQRYEELTKEIKELSAQVDQAQKDTRKAAIQKAREQYSPAFAKEYADAAENFFGTTDDFSLAGYLDTNGELLDFSEGQGDRVQDHREVAEVLDFLPERYEYSDPLIEFMNLGNIRIMTHGVEITVEPNAKQRAQLERFFEEHNGEVSVDFSDQEGRSAGSLEYEAYTDVEDILHDIDEYFRTGDVSQKSDTAKFHGDFSQELPGIEELRREDRRLVQQARKEGWSDARLRQERLAAAEKVFQYLIEEYGAIPAGESPARSVQVPRRTGGRERVSQTVRTILEAKATPDSAIPSIQELAVKGEFSYETVTDREAIARAESAITDRNWGSALAEWKKDMAAGKVSKDNTAMGWALYNNAANSGNLEVAMDILQEMVKSQRSAAQALQATRILKQLSPEAQLYGVVQSVEGLQKELNERYGETDAPELKIDEDLGRRLLEARTQEERDAVLRDIYRDIGRQMPSRLRDKWNAWRYLSMLGNPRTHVRNIVGNAGFAPVVMAKDLVATAVEKAVSAVSGGGLERSKALVGLGKADRALLSAAWADYASVEEAALGGGKYSDLQSANKYIEEGRVIFRGKAAGKALETARKANSYALDVEDIWFSKPHYAYALAQFCKAHKITEAEIRRGNPQVLAAARNYAVKEAQKATYRDTNALSQTVSRLGRDMTNGKNPVSRGLGVLVEGILPFRKTPANILARGLEYSPLGLLKGLGYDLGQVRRGNMTGAEAIDNISAGLTGTGLLALGLYLAAQGLVRGRGSGDDKERELAELQGHQGYSMELPDGRSITLDWLAPEALPFFVGVNLWEVAQSGEGNVTLAQMLEAVGNVSEPMLEMSCLQSLNDALEVGGRVSSDGLGVLPAVLVGAASSYLTQGLPTLLGQLERVTEKERESTYTEKNAFLTPDIQYTLGKVSGKVPGWEFQQIPYIDAWGRHESNGGVGARAFHNLLNPAYTAQIEESPMEQELLRLYRATGETGVLPKRAAKTVVVNGQARDLTAKEYVRYAEQRGQVSLKLVTALTESKLYAGLEDGVKAECVVDAYTYANQVARSAVDNGANVDAWVIKAREAEETYKLPVATYILLRNGLQDIGSLKDKNGEAIDNSRGLLIMQKIYEVKGLNDEQRRYLFEAFGVGKSVSHYNRTAVEEALERMEGG